MFSLEGKVALVSGASRGIGEAIAKGLAKAGAELAISSRKLPNLMEVADEVKKLTGRKCIPIECHVGKVAELDRLVKTVVEEYGKIDILVNNAGINPVPNSSLDIEPQAWDRIMDVNLKGLFFLSQKVVSIMIQHGGGSIVNIGSRGGITPSSPGGSGSSMPAYSISKAGVIMATKVMALDFAQYKIRVNCIAPGLIRSRFSQGVWTNDEALKKTLSLVPLREMGEPEDVVGAVIYLASDASRYVTGVTIPVDGGRVI